MRRIIFQDSAQYTGHPADIEEAHNQGDDRVFLINGRAIKFDGLFNQPYELIKIGNFHYGNRLSNTEDINVIKDAGITGVALLSSTITEDWEEAESLFKRNGIRQVQILAESNLFQCC